MLGPQSESQSVDAKPDEVGADDNSTPPPPCGVKQVPLSTHS